MKRQQPADDAMSVLRAGLREKYVTSLRRRGLRRDYPDGSCTVNPDGAKLAALDAGGDVLEPGWMLCKWWPDAEMSGYYRVTPTEVLPETYRDRSAGATR